MLPRPALPVTYRLPPRRQHRPPGASVLPERLGLRRLRRAPAGAPPHRTGDPVTGIPFGKASLPKSDITGTPAAGLPSGGAREPRRATEGGGQALTQLGLLQQGQAEAPRGGRDPQRAVRGGRPRLPRGRHAGAARAAPGLRCGRRRPRRGGAGRRGPGRAPGAPRPAAVRAEGSSAAGTQLLGSDGTRATASARAPDAPGHTHARARAHTREHAPGRTRTHTPGPPPPGGPSLSGSGREGGAEKETASLPGAVNLRATARPQRLPRPRTLPARPHHVAAPPPPGINGPVAEW